MSFFWKANAIPSSRDTTVVQYCDNKVQTRGESFISGTFITAKRCIAFSGANQLHNQVCVER